MGDPASLEHLATAAIARFGAVHVICNNAGVIRSGRSWELSAADWDTVLRVNLLGVIHDTLKMELAAAGAPIGVSIVMPGRVPSRLGRPPEDPTEPIYEPGDPEVLPASEVGRIVLDAVRSDRMYVFTHPGRLPEVRERFGRITAD